MIGSVACDIFLEEDFSIDALIEEAVTEISFKNKKIKKMSKKEIKKLEKQYKGGKNESKKNRQSR